ncbi:hypothetical protein KGO95_03835 [Patescibacteria group bacterium]|nr:hypothetical protein [Patescibacteria group bacterium]MDE2020358.1 hypothetical protein [Patescibacteria group bacterium]
MYNASKDYRGRYTRFLTGKLNLKRQLTVVADCSNGTTGPVIKKLKAKNKKLKIILLNDRPDGNFPAHGPNPMALGAMDRLQREVKKRKADLGVIFDADGDRVFFVDDRGRRVGADEAGFALAQLFRPPFVVGTTASWRLKRLKSFVSPVGHSFFKALMRKKKASLGLEHSGHFYFKDFFYCDSGIFAAIQMMNFVSGLENGFAAWLDALPKYYRSGEINFRVHDKKAVLNKVEMKYRRMATKISRSDGLTMEFGGARPELAEGWWFNVRSSNTENLLRLNVEAHSKKVLQKELRTLKEIGRL